MNSPSERSMKFWENITKLKPLEGFEEYENARLFGPYLYDDGVTYYGEFRSGNRHGFGRQVSGYSYYQV